MRAALHRLSERGVRLPRGPVDLSNRKPAEACRVALSFDIDPQVREDEVKLEFSVADPGLHEWVA